MKTNKIIGLVVVLIFSIASIAFAQDSLKIYLQKGGRGLLDRDFDKALLNFESALLLSPANFSALKNLGVVHSATGDQKLAKQYFQNAYKINPNDADLNNNLAVMFSNEGNALESIKYFENAVALDSSKALYMISLAQEYSKYGEISKAFPLLRKAQKMEPSNPLIHFSLANCFAESRSNDSAEVYYKNSIANGGKSWDTYYFLGRVQQNQGKLAQAEVNYQEAYKLNSNCNNCVQSLGVTHVSMEKYSDAISDFKLLIKKDSTNNAGWIGLGSAYSLNDQVDKANEILSKLFKIDSSLGDQMLLYITQEHKLRKLKKK